MKKIKNWLKINWKVLLIELLLVFVLALFGVGMYAKGVDDTLNSECYKEHTFEENVSNKNVRKLGSLYDNQYYYRYTCFRFGVLFDDSLTIPSDLSVNFEILDDDILKYFCVSYSLDGIHYFADLSFDLSLFNFRSYSSSSGYTYIYFQYINNDITYNLYFDLFAYIYDYYGFAYQTTTISPSNFPFKINCTSSDTSTSSYVKRVSSIHKYEFMIDKYNTSFSSTRVHTSSVFNNSYSDIYLMYDTRLVAAKSVGGITQGDLENARQEGYNQGYQEGLDEGYTSGVNSSNIYLTYANVSINGYLYNPTDTSYIIDDDKEGATSVQYGLNLEGSFEELYSNAQNNNIDLTSNPLNSYERITFNTNKPTTDTLKLKLGGYYDYIQVGYLVNDSVVESSKYELNFDDEFTLYEWDFNFSKSYPVSYIDLYIDMTVYEPDYGNLNVLWNNFSLNNTFVDGVNLGIEQGKNEVITNPNEFDLYTKSQLDTQVENAYNNGYSIGNSKTCSLNSVFFAIADVPLSILANLLGFELFGMNMFLAFCSIVTLVLIFWLIKKLF